MSSLASRLPQPSRIITLDILRGYFILAIASVHLAYYPSLLGLFEGRGQLWVSEAEGFFFFAIPYFIQPSRFIINSSLELLIVTATWWAVRKRFFFSIIPR